jgi:hypothetical protein
MPLKFEANKIYADRQGKYITSTILPALWKEYGELSGASAVVLLAHSIGAMMATITAGSYIYTYSLAGLITSGTGAEMNLFHTQSFTNLIEPSASHGNFDPLMKDQMMLKSQICLLQTPK